MALEGFDFTLPDQHPEELLPIGPPDPLLCVPCLAAFRLHEGEGPAPQVRPAIVIVGGTSVCDEHFAVRKQSPLLGPNNAPFGMGVNG